ncbi:MAG TPA: lysylphosphatidylglycerol synthase transmembrane domain-containing protein [Kofleriaceae bacterium]|nr:lysylphosphatidylglycerol synthase transmembrane domain-containing protein [Kofleriaceae bacterium]
MLRGCLGVSATTPEDRATGLRGWWQRWGWIARWGGTLAGFVYIARLIDFASVKTAFHRVSAFAMVATVVFIAVNVVAGAWRWRVLLQAYGAQSRPRFTTAVRLYFIAFFYNNFLPGAVAGDLMRGVVSRNSFGEHGTTGAIAVVLVERALGLFAVFSLVAVGLLLSGDQLSDTGTLWWWSLGGVAASVVSVFMLPFGRKLAPLFPGPLRAIAERLPVVTRPLHFVAAAALSLSTQILTALAGWVILRDLHPNVSIPATLLVVPLAAATTFLPITVGGAGAREAVFIALCAKLFGMSAADGLAASLLFWLATLIVGAAGGVVQLLTRSQVQANAA